MHIHHFTQNKGLIRQPALCVWLDLTRSGLDKLRKNDHTFPRPIKNSQTRQAAAYFVVAEINEWLASKIDARNESITASQKVADSASINRTPDAQGDAK